MTDRNALLDRLKSGQTFDLLVVGGGATGCGIALDAASRGLKVALVEKGGRGDLPVKNPTANPPKSPFFKGGLSAELLAEDHR